ncbi:MAG: T9SS type A sorting domain-containing protein, partial [Bacteroidales bacterium]|nr:T9SS type A sorting domain-containing protein [Bacteroidales bacterium]
GDQYTLTIAPQGCDTDNSYQCMYDASDNMVCRILGSGNYYTISDADGNYSIAVDRYSSGSLHAFSSDKQFNEINFVELSETNMDEDFNEIYDPTTPVSEMPANNTKIWAANQNIIVENSYNTIYIADISGRIVKTLNATSDRTEIPIQKQGIYIVKTGATTQKVIIR